MCVSVWVSGWNMHTFWSYRLESNDLLPGAEGTFLEGHLIFADYLLQFPPGIIKALQEVGGYKYLQQDERCVKDSFHKQLIIPTGYHLLTPIALFAAYWDSVSYIWTFAHKSVSLLKKKFKSEVFLTWI